MTLACPVRLESPGPFGLRLTVEPVGRDLLCRVGGGAAHVGAVALAEWSEGARTRCLSARGHREEAIARHAAHSLCTASQRTVVCVAGIHFDDVTRSDIEEISRRATELAEEAARIVRDPREGSDASAEEVAMGTFDGAVDAATLVDYQEGAVVSRQVVKSRGGSVTAFAFDAGEGLSEHTTPHEALVYVLEGTARLEIAGTGHRVDAGQLIRLPAGVPHALRAGERFKMLLVMVRTETP